MVQIEVVDNASLLRLELARDLVREYAVLPHVNGRWFTADAEIAALPAQYVSPTGVFLVATENGGGLGCGALRANDTLGMAEVKRMYVRPSARGRGVGALLLQALLDHAVTLGFSNVRLDTATELTAARTLYERFGFLEIPRYRDDLLPDAVCYGRALLRRDHIVD